MTKDMIATDSAPLPVGPYAQAIRAHGWLYVSGQIPLDPETGDLVDGSFEKQVRRTLDNITAILEAGGSNRDLVVKTTVYLTDMTLFSQFNEIYTEYFNASRPARVCVAVKELPKAAPLEIDAVALCNTVT